ncbi:hypothetical protein [Streptomyces rugosispiralis]|uniref:Uncharacterized protein n=1 Tax=Streptomyces rugosispiralis TaxID=2967341 RepID=A0ABT1URH3_9ACTN|nr:hypothetical protein [Streptomyces rugosispiralis]MCQ8187699.1 hypothetical protein [Streptomyces rugosispiralis]
MRDAHITHVIAYEYDRTTCLTRTTSTAHHPLHQHAPRTTRTARLGRNPP